jgi:hypothetical protein
MTAFKKGVEKYVDSMVFWYSLELHREIKFFRAIYTIADEQVLGHSRTHTHTIIKADKDHRTKNKAIGFLSICCKLQRV